MRSRLPEKLWLDAGDPPAGWVRGDADLALRRLRERRVRALALGMPASAALRVAQAVEQGAFNGTAPRCEVDVRLPEGDERAQVEAAVAAARRHWETVPTRPPEVPPKPSPARIILIGLGLHVAGFLVVVALFEGWCLLVRHEHAAGVGWVVRQVHDLLHGVR